MNLNAPAVVLALAAAALLIVALVATSEAAPHERSCDGKPATFHEQRAGALIADAYRLERWQDPTPARGSEKRAWQEHKACIRDAAMREDIERERERVADRFARYRELREVTPYSCGGTWDRWAIPCDVIICETRADPFSWTIESPDGGLGPYQHTPWASHVQVPWPVRSWEDKMAHHRAADYLRRTGGLGRWSCA